jgi:hypothetical protein
MVATERVRAVMPPPHGCEHSSHDDHGLRTQSIGQFGSSTQLCVSLLTPHSAPPNWVWAMMVRDLL